MYCRQQHLKDKENDRAKWGLDPWNSGLAIESPRCSSMSLTDLVETASSDPLVDNNVNMQASNRQNAWSDLIHHDFAKEADTDRAWIPCSMHSHSSPSRKSMSKRELNEISSHGGTSHGLLHCTLREGLPSYTFLLDEQDDEVITAKVWVEDVMVGEDQGAWRYTFYSLRGEKNRRKGKKNGWKHWSQKEKLVSEPVGKMTVSSVLCSERAIDGTSTVVSVQSEFVLSAVKPHHGSSIRSDYTCQSSLSTMTETGPSHFCSSTKSNYVAAIHASASPQSSRASSSDGGFSTLSSPSAISSWYVSQSLIPSSLASPEYAADSRQKSWKWSFHTKIPGIWSRKTKRNNELIADSSSKAEEEDEAAARGAGLNEASPDSELAAMIINVPLEVHETEKDSTAKRVLDRANLNDNHGWCEHSSCVLPTDAEMQMGCHVKHDKPRYPSITIILPSGSHGRPRRDAAKGPSPLIKRWKEGGKCDCKGWDLGCGMVVLCNLLPKTQPVMQPYSSRLGFLRSDGKHLALYKQDADHEDAYVSLAPHENGLIAVDFRAPLSPLQAFAISVAILHGREPSVPDPHAPSGQRTSSASQRSLAEGDVFPMNVGISHSIDYHHGKGMARSSTSLNRCMSPVHENLSRASTKVQSSGVFNNASALSFDRL